MKEYGVIMPDGVSTTVKATTYKDAAQRYLNNVGLSGYKAIDGVSYEHNMKVQRGNHTKYFCIVEKDSYLATNIVWDTDGDKVELPKEVFISNIAPYTEGGVSDDEITEYLSYKYGFCVHMFDTDYAD